MATHSPRASAIDSETERAVRRLVERVYGAGELYHVDDVVAPDYVGRWAGNDDIGVGPAGVRANAARFRTAVGRLRVDLETCRVRNGGFEARWTARGRLERPFLGVEPSCVIGEAGVEPHGPAVTLRAVTRGTVRAGELVDAVTTWTLDGDGVDGAEARDGVGRLPTTESTRRPVTASSSRR